MSFTERYLELATGQFRGLNLTRVLDPREFEIKQYRDSLLPLEQSEVFRSSLEQDQLLVDIGFGGGFPILPLASKLPQALFIGLEARAKKVTAVMEIARKLDLLNVRCFHHRLETVRFDRHASVTLKAVGKIPDFLEMFHVEQSVRVRVFFYKGPNVEELENLKSIDDRQWKKVCHEKLELAGLEARYLIGYESINVPRGTKQDKNLVNLSSLI
jgi:16S rRNA (guanine527-N7)-methyltransferase